MKTIKKYLVFAVCLLCIGCSVPGTYLDSSYAVTSSETRSTKDLKGKLLNTHIVPLQDNSLRQTILGDLHKPYYYRIGPYDSINVTVWNHPELAQGSSGAASLSGMLGSNPLQSAQTNAFSPSNANIGGIFVDSQGEITFPLIGRVKIAGLTVDETRQKLTNRLQKYIRNPQLSVQVVGFNSQRVHVLGEVVQPGIKSLNDRPLTILDALSLSGGIKPETADAKHIYILRINNPQNISVYWLNAKTPQALVLAEYFRLADNDIIYVSPAGVISWNRVVGQILPTIQVLWETQSFIEHW